MIRRLLPADVEVAQAVQWAALSDLDACFVAEVDGEVVAMTMALVREGMWFLSLLMVLPDHQGVGHGARLLEQVLATATDRCSITSTQDPAALRRYRRAGFTLHPAFQAKGPLDRSLLPATPGVREGSYDADADLVEELLRQVRGAALGPDLPYLRSRPMRFLVADDAAVAFLRPDGVASVVGAHPDAAARVLTAALAECTEDPHVSWLTADQQWAVEVCLDLRLPLTGGASICLRGQAPMTPYLPNGALG